MATGEGRGETKEARWEFFGLESDSGVYVRVSTPKEDIKRKAQKLPNTDLIREKMVSHK